MDIIVITNKAEVSDCLVEQISKKKFQSLIQSYNKEKLQQKLRIFKRHKNYRDLLTDKEDLSKQFMSSTRTEDSIGNIRDLKIPLNLQKTWNYSKTKYGKKMKVDDMKQERSRLLQRQIDQLKNELKHYQSNFNKLEVSN